MTQEALYRLPEDGRAATRPVVPYLLTAGGVAVALFWGAAELFARRVAFHPALGAPWLASPPVAGEFLVIFAVALAGLCAAALLSALPRATAPVFGFHSLVALALASGPLYSPAHLVVWHRRFEGAAGELLEPYWRVASLGSALAFGVALLALAAAPRPRKPDIHGSARFATRADLRKADLVHPAGATVVGPPGLFLGCWSESPRRRFSLYDDGDTHAFCFAPTRTGKGVSLVIPNMLLWPGSALVIDVKSEIFELTSGYRGRELGNVCLRFDPTNPGSARYNPLSEVRINTPNDVRDAQNVADILVDPNGDRPRDHWDRTAHALLTAVILHVLYVEKDRTLTGCAYLLSRPGTDVAKTLKAMIESHHLPSGPHPVVASLAQAVLDKASEERSGVISTALSFLDLFRDPLIAANTSASDFRIADLMSHEQPVTLYLTLPPSDLNRTRPLIRLFLNQACRRLTEQPLKFANGRPVAHYRHRLLLLMDELTALGRLAFFAESLAYLAGYGIRALLVCQDLSQLQGAYGRTESITSNAHFRIAFTPNKTETAELLSQMAGTMTVHQSRRTRRAGGPLFASSSSLTPAESQRRLLTADEAMRLPPEDALIFAAGLPPIRATKAPYYLDPELQRRAAISPVQHRGVVTPQQ